MGEARDWGTGLPLKASLLGKMSRLEVHHIFPKAQLYKRKHKRPEVNALANFCFLTKDTNLNISDRLPEEYFPEIEEDHPGALASQWIPTDPALWKIENFRDFLEARKGCWRPRRTGAWKSCCTARRVGSKARPQSVPAPIVGERRHHERGRGGGTRSAERLDGGAGIAARHLGL